MSSLSIVADQKILFAKEAFSGFGNVELVDGRAIEQQIIQDADVLLVRSVTKVDETLLKTSNVKFVGSATSGIDHIDTEYLKRFNISFSHALGSNARSVAEYILSSLIVTAEQQGFNLTEKTVGIVGCGQVGSRVKRFMAALGIKCLLNDPLLAKQTSENKYVELDEIQNANIITLHVPLTKDCEFPTHKLVDKAFLNKLKADVVLINTSRGKVIDETALLDFKDLNSTATLILDVWCNEPNIDINLLKSTFIATPHIAGYSYDGKLKATEMLFNALNDYLDTELSQPSLLNSKQSMITVNDDIQLAILQSYDVRSDAIALANLVNIDEEQRASYFDSLRRNYPIRHEFKTKVVQTNTMNHQVEKQLQQLGFKLGAT